MYCSVECRRTDSANGTVPVSDDDDGSGSYLDKVDLTVLSVHARSHLFNHEDNFVGQNHERTGAWSTPVSMGCSPTGSLGSSPSKTSFLLASPSQQPGRPRASSSEDTSVTSHRSGGHAVFASTFTGTRPVQQPQQGAGNRSVNSPSPPPQLLMEIRAHKTSSLLRDDLPRRRGTLVDPHNSLNKFQ